MHKMTPEVFWGKVDKSGGPDACWPFTPKANGRGYGKCRWHGTFYQAHRIAAYLTGIVSTLHIDKSNPVYVLHSCDNPRCCNPKHLEAGTQSKNILDAFARGRAKAPRIFGRTERGKFSYQQAQEIRARYAEGGVTQTQLAAQYNVSQAAISQIIRGKVLV